MNRNNILSVLAVVVVVGLIAGAIAYVSAPKSKYSAQTLDAFAQCLAAKKVTMYGAVWCPHCQAEKARFGASFQYVPYVECPQNEKLCLDKGIKGYPTWITADGALHEGEQGLEGLAAITGCPLVP